VAEDICALAVVVAITDGVGITAGTSVPSPLQAAKSAKRTIAGKGNPAVVANQGPVLRCVALSNSLNIAISGCSLRWPCLPEAPVMLFAALLGFAFGWLGSVPVAGPIAALVVTRGIQGRFRAGVFIALGGALAEAVYAFLAFWGFSTFLTQYPIIVPLSRAAAAVVLMALGIVFLRTKEASESEVPPADSAFGSFMLGASICALNPTLIATWTAVVTTLYSTSLIDFHGAQAVPFGLGALAGIAGWFLTLLWIIHRYRERFSPATLAKTVRVIGGALILLALWFVFRFVQYFL